MSFASVFFCCSPSFVLLLLVAIYERITYIHNMIGFHATKLVYIHINICLMIEVSAKHICFEFFCSAFFACLFGYILFFHEFLPFVWFPCCDSTLFLFLIVTRLAFVHARTCVYLFGNIQQCVLLCLVEWISRKLIYMYNCIICNAMRKMFQQNLLLAFSFTEKKHSNNGTQSRKKEKNTNQMAPNHFHSISLENLEHLNKTI